MAGRISEYFKIRKQEKEELENQAARSRETRICGINPITHMIIVFLK